MCNNQNQCVICGARKKLTKHHVVPQSFLKYVEQNLRPHNNLVNLCRRCHDLVEMYNVRFRKRLAEKYGFEYHDEDEWNRACQLRQLARVIVRYRKQARRCRRIRAYNLLKDMLEKEDDELLPPSTLRKLCDAKPHKVNAVSQSIMKSIDNDEDLKCFYLLWKHQWYSSRDATRRFLGISKLPKTSLKMFFKTNDVKMEVV